MRDRKRGGGGHTVSTTYTAVREDFSVAAQNTKLPVTSLSLSLLAAKYDCAEFDF